MALATTAPLRRAIERLVPERPFTIEFWDGTALPGTRGGGPVFAVRSPRALAHLLRAPGQLGLSRAYVSGELEVDDLDALNRLLYDWRPPALPARSRITLMLAAARATGLILPPAAPAAELRPRGARHSPARDARAVRHHYDVSNGFFALFLDRSMTYSCAFFSRDGVVAGVGPGGQAGVDLPQAPTGAGPAGAGPRVRLGQLRHSRRRSTRRERRRHHPL